MAERATRQRYGGSYPEWQPGDPLWVHPMRDWGNDYAHVVRYMFDLLEDDEIRVWQFCEATFAHCYRCYVSWDEGADGRFCWSCGAVGTPAGVYRQDAA